jgi:hypothetical protein
LSQRYKRQWKKGLKTAGSAEQPDEFIGTFQHTGIVLALKLTGTNTESVSVKHCMPLLVRILHGYSFDQCRCHCLRVPLFNYNISKSLSNLKKNVKYIEK